MPRASILGGRTPVGLEIEGDVEHSRHELVLLLAIATLATLDANGLARFVRAVAEQCRLRWGAIGVWGECRHVHISSANIVEIVRGGDAVEDLEGDIYSVIDGVLHSRSDRKADRHSAVLFALGVHAASLSLGSERPQINFLSLEVGEGIVTENAHSQGDVRSEVKFLLAGHETEEIKIALQRQFPYVRIKAQVAAMHVFIVGVVDIRIT